MIHSIILIILLAVSSVKAGTFAACSNYIFTPAYLHADSGRFDSLLADGAYFQGSSENAIAIVSAATTCQGIYLNSYSFDFYGTYTSCATLTEFGVGIWVNFESTKATKTLIIGDRDENANTFTAHSDTDGVLVFSFIQDSSSKDTNDFSLTVPLNDWTFLAFDFSGKNLKIYMPGQAEILKTKTGQYDYANPTDGYFLFGSGIKAHIYQVIGFNKASISSDYYVITLTDTNSNNYDATGWNCVDTVCHPTIGSLTQLGDCSACDATSCTQCKTAGRYALNYCNTMCSTFCAECSSDSVCTKCKSNHFLWDKAAYTFCISCDTSCSSCTPSPNCFKCADSISQDGSSCKVNKIGYQIGFSSPNIEIDFAHPLVTGLTVNDLTAKTEAGVTIDTSKWKLNTCSAGVMSCIIVTDNLSESQLPIDLSLKFNQA